LVNYYDVNDDISMMIYFFSFIIFNYFNYDYFSNYDDYYSVNNDYEFN